MPKQIVWLGKLMNWWAKMCGTPFPYPGSTKEAEEARYKEKRDRLMKSFHMVPPRFGRTETFSQAMDSLQRQMYLQRQAVDDAVRQAKPEVPQSQCKICRHYGGGWFDPDGKPHCKVLCRMYRKPVPPVAPDARCLMYAEAWWDSDENKRKRTVVKHQDTPRPSVKADDIIDGGTNNVTEL
jgi:hypothetical protein